MCFFRDDLEQLQEEENTRKRQEDNRSSWRFAYTTDLWLSKTREAEQDNSHTEPPLFLSLLERTNSPIPEHVLPSRDIWTITLSFVFCLSNCYYLPGYILVISVISIPIFKPLSLFFKVAVLFIFILGTLFLFCGILLTLNLKFPHGDSGFTFFVAVLKRKQNKNLVVTHCLFKNTFGLLKFTST